MKILKELKVKLSKTNICLTLTNSHTNHLFIFTHFSNDQLSVAEQELKLIIRWEHNNGVCISYKVSRKVV